MMGNVVQIHALWTAGLNLEEHPTNAAEVTNHTNHSNWKTTALLPIVGLSHYQQQWMMNDGSVGVSIVWRQHGQRPLSI